MFQRKLTANDTGTTSAATNASLPSVPASATSFSYDAWGNLNQTGPYSFSQPIAANNQIASYTYDLAGNLTHDGVNSYAYRADGYPQSRSAVIHGNQRTLIQFRVICRKASMTCSPIVSGKTCCAQT